jgi:hypothetical protein
MPADRDLLGVRALVDSALAARAVLEVLDDVRDVGVVALDPGFGERPVEQRSRRPDEWPALAVLAIARLLADEEQACFGFAPRRTLSAWPRARGRSRDTLRPAGAAA